MGQNFFFFLVTLCSSYAVQEKKMPLPLLSFDFYFFFPSDLFMLLPPMFSHGNIGI